MLKTMEDLIPALLEIERIIKITSLIFKLLKKNKHL
jgi:hypothetical protein